MFVIYTDEGSFSTSSADEALTLYDEALEYSESPSIWQGDPAKSDWQPVTPDDLIDVAADEFSRKADAALVAAFEHDQML
jgi:hypothetical protein